MSRLATSQVLNQAESPNNALSALSQVSQHLSNSYQYLEQQVRVLNDALAKFDTEKTQYLFEKEALSAQLDSLIEAIPSAAIVLDTQHKVIAANDSAKWWLHDDILGLNWEAVQADCLIRHETLADQYSLKSGRVVAMSTSTLGVQAGQLVLLSDKTEQQDGNKHAEHKTKLSEMGAFSASLAHQIRSPLASALLYASQLTSNTLGGQAQQQLSVKLLDRLRVLDSQVSDMLRYSHCGEFVKQPIGLSSFIECLERFYDEKRIMFHVSEFHESATIKVNQEALIGAVGNLLDNALDASNNSQDVLCSIELTEEKVLRISVKDQGVGLSEIQQQKIFKPFYSNKSNGTGLGLAVVQQVVNAHAGEINCVSNLDVGTVMVIRLPVLISPLIKQSNRSL